MKNSYYQTPRTMRDCTFSEWGDPFEKPEVKSASWIGWVIVLCVIIVGAAIAYAK